jgi:hypothetical protein
VAHVVGSGHRVASHSLPERSGGATVSKSRPSGEEGDGGILAGVAVGVAANVVDPSPVGIEGDTALDGGAAAGGAGLVGESRVVLRGGSAGLLSRDGGEEDEGGEGCCAEHRCDCWTGGRPVRFDQPRYPSYIPSQMLGKMSRCTVKCSEFFELSPRHVEDGRHRVGCTLSRQSLRIILSPSPRRMNVG